MKRFFKQLAAVASAFFLLLSSAGAVSAVTTVTLPGVNAGTSPGVSSYLSSIYTLGVGLAGVLAVLMIVIGGIQYIGSGMSPSAKEDAKGRITNAILGLLLALASWLILNTINPNLVSLRF